MSDNNSGSAPSGRRSLLATPRAFATPSRNANGTDAVSARRSELRRHNVGATPHARAARRTIDQRRTAIFTPGRARRRSLREQRATPRDALRNLSRLLAPASQVVTTSSSPDSAPEDGNSSLLPLAEADEEDDDDDFPIERPRFSLPMGPDDDDDIDLKPPRLSGLEDENLTVQSIELPRRAIQDRSSLNSMRISDYMGPDVQSDDVGIDSGFFPPPAMDETEEVMMGEPPIIEHLDADERRQTMGQDSIFGAIEIPDAGNETTFMMAPIESPVRDPSRLDAIENSDDGQDDGAAPLFEMDDDDDNDDMNEAEDLPEFEPNVDGGNDNTLTRTIEAGLTSHKGPKRKKGKKVSRHGIEYPSLPANVVKRLATTFARTTGSSKSKIAPDTLDAIMQATDWYFEQLGDDLSAYAKHAGRNTINESDMITLMRRYVLQCFPMYSTFVVDILYRQRQTNSSTTPFTLAQRHLPRELLQEVRMPVPVTKKLSRKKARRSEVDGEEEVA
ncbi:centromere kinetochore component CENP-T-domain-containing protein [Xylariaceae sp. FL1272]|nr:centromere kinetochore component CENP-T-domain-containing protein [Xylariaceae sp. FL1272]